MNICFVADLTRYDQGPSLPDRSMGNPQVQKGYNSVATGLIACNLDLVAASQGLAACFHHANRDAAVKDFKRRPDQRVLYVQSVGYPA